MLQPIAMNQPTAPLEFRMLGELELRRDDRSVELPPSKKTRALLAYLVLTGRLHRRDNLCQLFWDVTDDPRGALRWSLSKLRKQVDDGDTKRICSDRERVGFEAHGARVDVLDMRQRFARKPLSEVPTDELEGWCERCTGEVLEGLDLPDFDAYQAWLTAEREETRRMRAAVLAELSGRHTDDPARALPHALGWTQIDPMSSEARLTLIQLCLRAGKVEDAKAQYQTARRMFSELDPKKERALTASWHSLRSEGPATEPPPAAEPEPVRRSRASVATSGSHTQELSAKLASMLPLTGREQERRELTESLAGVTHSGQARLMLVTGEPGIGKSRLLDELMLDARKAGHPVLHGAAFEGETGRPYGPWIDALRKLPPRALSDEARQHLAPLLDARVEGEERSREQLFSGVERALSALAEGRSTLLVTLEDVHWLDEGSAELLHYVVRMKREQPVLFVLTARGAELHDSREVLRVLRSLRRDVEQADLPLAPLSREATASLIACVNRELDPADVHSHSGGNPLFALELARSGAALDGRGSLTDAVRDRLDRLTPEAADVLRWCAVLGAEVDPKQLAALSSLDAEEQLLALEELELHALLRDEGRGYSFSHDIVRQAVYASLSQPRRVLMHRRAAEALRNLAGGRASLLDEERVSDVARHAALAEDHTLAASAYIAAGQRCLKLSASQNAAALARRGLRHARQLPEPERARTMLALYDIQLWAQKPADPERFCCEVQTLSETALAHGCQEHARLGFNMLSYVRWESGDWNEARKQMLMAEETVRDGEGEDRIEALAQAARCLALLERDMGHAETLLREAEARASQMGTMPSSLADAQGLMQSFLGKVDAADRLFEQARVAARTKRNRYAELQAMMSRFELLFDCERLDKAREVAEETRSLAEKTRDGSEGPYARTMVALVKLAAAEPHALQELGQALDALREADAKYRLAYALTRSATLLESRGEREPAYDMAAEALDIALLLERPTEVVLALVVMARVQKARGDGPALARTQAELAKIGSQKASAHARKVLSQWQAEE